MSKIKILIIEDELIIAESMKEMLQELEYDVIGTACDTDEVNEVLAKELPDIVLIDIQLRNGDDGIELAKSVKDKYKLPIIFITSHSDKQTVEKAKEAQPEGYIVKPFEKSDLYTSIEIAMSNFLRSKSTHPEKEEDNYYFKEYLFVKKKYQFEKVKIQNIQWIKSDGNYLELHCLNKINYVIRSTFDEFFQIIPPKIFIKVHKSYAINFDYIDSVRQNELIIDKEIIPIGKTYKENIRNKLNIVN